MDLEKNGNPARPLRWLTKNVIKTKRDVECLTSIVQFKDIWAKGDDSSIVYDLSINVPPFQDTVSYGGNK